MDASNIIKFGIFDDYTLSFGTGNITNIYQINHRECIASTTKEFSKFERTLVKMKHPFIFSTCVMVPNTEFLIGVTAKYNDLVVAQMSDISRPLIEKYQTNHTGIFHMYYSPKSNAIITIGSGIHVFNFHYNPPDKHTSVVRPKVSISLRSVFAKNYDTPILTPPAFDQERELLFLPTPDGICPFTLDGEQLSPFSKYPASIKTVFTYNQKSQKMLVYDSNGMVLWGPKGQFLQQFTTAGSSVLAMIFVDNENVICLNSYNTLFFLNIKTGRTFHCLTLPQRPTRLFLVRYNNQPILCVCFSSLLKAMKLIIPWYVWNLNVANTLQMCRCNKFCDAARVLVDSTNSFIKLFSPKDASKMTVATPVYAINPVSYLYDRGIFEKHFYDAESSQYKVEIHQTFPGSKRDMLFILLDNGSLIGFDTGSSPCEEVMKMSCKAAFMVICRSDDKWSYAIASENSDLYIYDYSSFKETRHYSVVDDKLLKMFYHYDSDCIIMVFKKKTILFDLKKGQIIDELAIRGNRATALFSNFLKYGYESGYITQVDITDRRFIAKDLDNMQRPHMDTITSFSFSQQFWVSTGLDGYLIIWNYDMEKICQLTFPLPLYSGLVMNGKRDILVATETEVMITKGDYIFRDGEIDYEVSEIDNFDRLKDGLCRDYIIPDDDEDIEDDGGFLKNRKEEEKEVKKDFHFEATNYSKSIPAKPLNVNPSPPIESKPKVGEEDEDAQKKFEKMQALNGIGPPQKVPAVVPILEKKNVEEDEENKEKEEKVGDYLPKKSRPRKEAKSITDFINDTMEQEKSMTKRRKVKKQKVTENVDEKPKTSSEDINNLMDSMFGRNKPPPPKAQKKEVGKDIDISALAKQFHKDNNEDEEILLKMKNSTNNNNSHKRNTSKEKVSSSEYYSSDDENDKWPEEKPKKEQAQKQIVKKVKKDPKITEPKEKPVKKEKPPKEQKSPKEPKPPKELKEKKVPKPPKVQKEKVQKVKKPKTPKAAKKQTKNDDEEQHKEEEEKVKEVEEEEELVENEETKTEEIKKEEIEQEEIKKTEEEPPNDITPNKTLISIGTQPEFEEENPGFSSTTTANDVVNVAEPKNPPLEIVKNKNPIQPEKKIMQKSAPLKSPRRIPLSKPNNDAITQPPKRVQQTEVTKNVPNGKFVGKIVHSAKIGDKRLRCPTPPPIRWAEVKVKQRIFERARTPPMKKVNKIFTMPPPNIILDREAVFIYFGRGRSELKPLVERLEKDEKNSNSNCILLPTGRMRSNRQDFCPFFTPLSGNISYRNRFFHRANPENYGPNPIEYLENYYCNFNNYLYDSPNQNLCSTSAEKDQIPDFDAYILNSQRISATITTNDLIHDDSKPKFFEMQHSRPLNLIDAQKKQPSIKMPSNAHLCAPPNTSNAVQRRARFDQSCMFQATQPQSAMMADNVETDQHQHHPIIDIKALDNESDMTYCAPQPPPLRTIYSARCSPAARRTTWSIKMPAVQKPSKPPNFAPPSLSFFMQQTKQASIKQQSGEGCVDMLATAVLSKVPKLGLITNRNIKSVRRSSPPARHSSRRLISAIWPPGERKGSIDNAILVGNAYERPC